MIPYFERFIARFPTLASLAAASEDEVTALWSGLGLLRAGAQPAGVRRWRPSTSTAASFRGPRRRLGELPGLGPYTAAAVAAIAFGARTFALDGNGARVMARLGGVSDSIDLPATRVRLRAAGTREVPRGRPGDFTQAVMELGATVCTPRNPRCDACPLRTSCAARAAGTVGGHPPPHEAGGAPGGTRGLRLRDGRRARLAGQAGAAAFWRGPGRCRRRQSTSAAASDAAREVARQVAAELASAWAWAPRRWRTTAPSGTSSPTAT